MPTPANPGAPTPGGRSGPPAAGPVTAPDRTGRAREGGRIDLSIVVPAFNEAARLEAGFDRLRRAAKDGAFAPDRTEIIVVDDGSTDTTADRASDLLADYPLVRIHRLPANRGKGAAIRAGVGLAQGPLVAHMDADMAIHPFQVGALTDALGSSDLAIGTRARVEPTSQRSVLRFLTGRIFNLFVNGVTHVGLRDSQCGFKAFRTPVARLLFHLLVIERFAFDVQVVANARWLGFSIAEVPVHWQDVADSRIRLARDPVAMALDVLRVRRRLPEPPAVPAVSVGARRPAVDGRAVGHAVDALVGPALALPVTTGARTLVLLPLRSSAEVGAMVDRLAAIPGAVARPLSVTARQLVSLAPLGRTASGAGGAADPTGFGVDQS